MSSCVCVCVFPPDGVYSFLDGEPMHQDPPAAQDESAEEKEEEEEGDERWRGTPLKRSPTESAVRSVVMVTLRSISPAAVGDLWVPGADGELAGPDRSGSGAHKRAGNWHDSS